MNKQQLASKIWESANKMRSKIEANEYKDYILGFIFYKFLSDKEVDFLQKRGMSDEELQSLAESDRRTVDFCKANLGYFIAWKNLFSTWLERDAAKGAFWLGKAAQSSDEEVLATRAPEAWRHVRRPDEGRCRASEPDKGHPDGRAAGL